MTDPQERFIQNLKLMIENISDVIRTVNDEKGYEIVNPTVCDLAILGIKISRPEHLIERYIRTTWKCWDKILTKDIEYFENHAFDMFGSLPHADEYVEKMKSFVHNRYLTDEDIKIIWEFNFSFVRQSISYIDKNRGRFFDDHELQNIKLDYWRIAFKGKS